MTELLPVLIAVYVFIRQPISLFTPVSIVIICAVSKKLLQLYYQIKHLTHIAQGLVEVFNCISLVGLKPVRLASITSIVA